MAEMWYCITKEVTLKARLFLIFLLYYKAKVVPLQADKCFLEFLIQVRNKKELETFIEYGHK